MWLRFLFCLFFALPLYPSINQNNDVELWTSVYYEQQLTRQIYLECTNQWRFADDMSELIHVYLQGILFFEPSPNVLIAPGYRQSRVRSDTRPWHYVYEPFVEYILRKVKGGASIDFRNRIIYLMPEQSDNSWTWRGRLRWIRLEGRVLPYLSNEGFIDSRRGFYENRSTIGILVPIISHLSGDFDYKLRFRKSDHHWTHQHIFGVALALNF